MLYGAGDPHRDIQVRRDDLAGLAHLVVVGDIPGVHRGPGRADGRAQFVGHLLQQAEVLAAAEAAPAGQHDLCAGEFGAFRFGAFQGDETGQPGRVGNGAECLDRGCSALGGGCVKIRGADTDDLDRVIAPHRGERVAGIDGAHEGIGRFNTDNIRDHAHVQQCRHSRHQVFAEGIRRRQDMAHPIATGDHQRRQFFGQPVFIVRRIHVQHLADAGNRGPGFGSRAAVAAGHKQRYLPAQLRGCADGVQGSPPDGMIVVFRNNQDAHIRSPSLRCAVCQPVPARPPPGRRRSAPAVRPR